MALWDNLIGLLFGNWHIVYFELPKSRGNLLSQSRYGIFAHISPSYTPIALVASEIMVNIAKFCDGVLGRTRYNAQRLDGIPIVNR